MPLKEGSSREVISENIRTEMETGRPRNQAIAIAMRKAGAARRNADEGSSSPEEGETGSRTSPESVAPPTRGPKPPKQHTKQPAAAAKADSTPAENGGSNIPRVRGPRFLQLRAQARLGSGSSQQVSSPEKSGHSAE